MERLFIKKRMPSAFRAIISPLIEILRKGYMFGCYKLLPMQDKRVVFSSFYGRFYSDNPKAISEQLHLMDPSYEIVWLFIDPDSKKEVVPDYVTSIKHDAMRSIRMLATSKFWIDNFNKPRYTYKGKDHVYIQTWHGDRGFKKILHDSPFYTKNYRLIETDLFDLLVTGSVFAERVCRTAFKYQGAFSQSGCPRNDRLLTKPSDLIEKTKAAIGLKTDNVLMYAPTLRREASDNQTKQQIQNLDLETILETLEELYQEPWVCLVRAHSGVAGLSGIRYRNKIIDVSAYEDMNELLLVTSLLITDYSSCAGDFALLNRPIFLYQPDREEYMEKDRDFYFDIDSSPYMVAKNQHEMIELILGCTPEKAAENCRQILDFYETYETGQASERIVEYIRSFDGKRE
ncbi:MAG: CDP-glycerol glycerophosphotransferase family protein [Bacillota bacterium]|nr:CDP-glycerol glycerophosphotransferase family protein [Bacillota bacterium]MDW7676585.1 CDP-glycerol glycerophosphotransferase family protein [Bacillota bacterium]